MASQDESITAHEINNKFIVTSMYGSRGYPRATLVLSTVKIYYKQTTRLNNELQKIYRNSDGRHAERYLCQDLRSKLRSEGDKVKKVVVTLVQNYSPCEACANDMLAYKNEYDNKGIEISLTIQFANFYRHADNRQGLINLRENGVVLILLQGKESWKDFLDNTTFNLNYKEIKTLHRKAKSRARRSREKEDRRILSGIEAEARADVKTEGRSESESGSEE